MNVPRNSYRYYLSVMLMILIIGIPDLASASVVLNARPTNPQLYALPGSTTNLQLDFTVSSQSTEAFDPSKVVSFFDGGFALYGNATGLVGLSGCNDPNSNYFCLADGTTAIFKFNSYTPYPTQIVAIGQTVSFNYASITLGLFNSEQGDSLRIYEALNFDFSDGGYASTGTNNWIINIGPAPATVPIPTAAWLLGSGLICLAGVTRKRKQFN